MILNFQEFERDIKSIYAEGNMLEQFKRLKHHIENEQDNDKKPLTYDFLMRKYKEHIKWWNMNFLDKPTRFLSKEDKALKLNFYNYLGTKKYLDEVPLGKGEQKRDEYLFPPWMTISEINEIIKSVDKKIDERKTSVETGKILESEE